MAINAEQLNIILSARDKEFTKAMDRSQKRVAHFANKSGKDLSNTGRSFDALGTAAKRLGPALLAAFSVAAFKGAVDGAVAIGQLSKIAGISAGEFQVLTLASSQFGIEQEKLSDILKDVNDKFGDFTQTGAGPLADFFEFIAPKVGLTADAFADLSSDKKLGAYINALEKANLSQADMTFYMEAIASDSTALIGAFENNGAAIESMRTKAEDLGLVLEDDVIEKSKAAKQELALMSAVISTNLTTALVSIAPLLSGASTGIAALAQQARNLMDVYADIGSDGPVATRDMMIADAVSDIEAATAERENASRRMAELVNGRALEDMNLIDKGLLFAATRQRDAAVQDLGLLTFGLNQLQAQAEESADAVAEVVNPQESASSGLNNIIEQTAQLERQAVVNHTSAEALERQRISREKDAIVAKAMGALSGQGFTIENTALRAEAVAAGDAYEVAAIKASLILNPLEKAKAKTKQVKEEAITASEALLLMHDNLIKGSPLLQNLGFDAEAFGDVMGTVEQSMESAFMSMVDGTQTAGEAFKSMASDIIKELYRVLVVQKLVGMVSGAITGGLGGAPSSTLRPVARPSGRASGGSVMAGTAYTVGENGREPFVPSQNGRILSTSQAKSAIGGGGGGTTVVQNINISTGVQQTVRAEIRTLMPQISEAAKLAVSDGKRRGGSYGRSF